MTHVYIPQHLLTLADYLYFCEFSDEEFDLQCIYRTIINRAYYATYLHDREWILNNGEYKSLDYYIDFYLHLILHLVVIILKAINSFRIFIKSFKTIICEFKIL